MCQCKPPYVPLAPVGPRGTYTGDTSWLHSTKDWVMEMGCGETVRRALQVWVAVLTCLHADVLTRAGRGGPKTHPQSRRFLVRNSSVSADGCAETDISMERV